MTCGIYMIRNKVNGKMYIGQAIDIEGVRWKTHRRELKGDYHENKHLQNAWNKYGQDNFEFSILLECEESQLNTYEEYYIFELMTYDSRIGYNKNYGGSSGKPTEETKKKLSEAGKGRQHTEETKKKMSEAKKGKSFSEEHRKKLSENNIWNDKKRCEEARKKISEANKGRTLSDETKKKISESQKGENNPNYGKHRTEETRIKISKSHKGKTLSEETKQKISESQKGKTLSEETKKKISESQKGENNPNSKTIVQIDPNTNKIVNTYPGTHEAARQTGFSQGNINACCNNKYCRPGNNIYKGYKWMFLEDYERLI